MWAKDQRDKSTTLSKRNQDIRIRPFTRRTRLVPNQRRALLISQRDMPPMQQAAIHRQALPDPHDAEDGEAEGRPVDEGVGGLVREDGEEGEGDGEGGGEVALGGGECVCCGGGFEEEESEEDEDLGPDAGGVSEGIDAEGLEAGEENEDGRPPVVEREREVDEELIISTLRNVELLHDIVHMRDGRADEEGEDEGDDVVLAGPDADVDGVEEGEEGEAPGDAVDDGAFAGGEELVDDRAEQEEVDERPEEEGPRRGGEVGLFDGVVRRGGARDGVDVGAEEEDVDDHVHHLEENAILPATVRHIVKVMEKVTRWRSCGVRQ